jgi:hypothetical protein
MKRKLQWTVHYFKALSGQLNIAAEQTVKKINFTGFL